MIPLNVDFQIVKSLGLDAWGEPIEGETIDLKGNLRSEETIVKNSYGEEVVSKYQVLFVGMVAITHDDTIQFTEANGEPQKFNPITVKYMRDLDGSIAYTKVVM